VVPLHLGYLLQMTLPTVASHPESSPAPGTGLHRLKANLANWLRQPRTLMGYKVSVYLFNVLRYIPIKR
jgi:hypothetical protein